jgi:type IV pilus assembly protein PilX
MKQTGFVLVVALIFLALMTMLGISMFSGFSLDETLSGNYREKNRSIDAAQMALDVAQNWMTIPGNTYTGNWITGVNCDLATVQPAVCSNALANADTLPWTSVSSASFAPANMTVSTAGGLDTYAAKASYHLQYVGNKDPYNALYRVTATAQGGNATAVTVLQAVYQVHATAAYLGGE